MRQARRSSELTQKFPSCSNHVKLKKEVYNLSYMCLILLAETFSTSFAQISRRRAVAQFLISLPHKSFKIRKITNAWGMSLSP